jgi:membrane fusion protein, multidrug efflux system
MALGFTRRRVVAGLAGLVVIGAVGGAVALRAAKKGEQDEAKNKAKPTLEFTQADLAFVDRKPLARWLPVSGTMQPVNQVTVKAKVPGEVRQLAVREGEAVKAGQLLARIDTADLETKLVERMGALESAKAQLALAEKTRAMNNKLLSEKFISQNAFDGSESSHSVAQGNLKSAEAQVRLAQNAIHDASLVAPLSGIVAKRHVQPGEKVAFDAPILTVVDLRQLELAALVPAVDVPELKVGLAVDLTVEGFGDRKFSGRIERINPSTEPGTRAFNVYVGLPNAETTLRSGMFATGRIAIAMSSPTPTLPLTAIRTEAGQSFVWTIDKGKLVRRIVLLGRRDDEAGVVEVKTELPPNVPVLAARFDNLKEGAAAIVKAPGASSNATSTPPATARPAG